MEIKYEEDKITNPEKLQKYKLEKVENSTEKLIVFRRPILKTVVFVNFEKFCRKKILMGGMPKQMNN